MLKSHERFHSINGKRQILIADDELINRELLRAVLQDSYELIFACNGREALDLARANKDTLSLILLDLMMPVMSGMDMLKQAKADPDIAQIPVIVISADQDAEVETLTIGAIDFIPKPYPQAGVILARVLRTIELSEDRQIINSTERDSLTGLYNREYFYRYAEQYDHHHKGIGMDAIVVDVNHFHMINERFGTAYGDNVLRRIGHALREAMVGSDGIVCRREADTFLIYSPHGVDYERLLDIASIRLASGDADSTRIWLRMGVYENVDKDLDIERRFDRAKRAADTVQGSFTKRVGVYDSTLHEKELYSEQLIEDFDTAIKEQQFQVYFQPKFDVQPEIPVLATAEALVRWQHPKLGFISPGVFIPLFEENGLIQRLDLYVWQATAERIRDWKDRFQFSVPVSVNVSRIDMYDPLLVDTLLQIVQDNGLEPYELRLEITESAYTQDSEQIIEAVHRLRELGFKIEMDDFGTGYSSLNMISTLPIDALKLDMQFIRNAFNERKETWMLEVIIDIADYLGVPVIAEGVETEEQMLALKEMGCDYVQGFYFSRPVPAEEYEQFVIVRRDQEASITYAPGQSTRQTKRNHESTFGDIAHALSSGFEVIYYIDTENNHYLEFSSRGKREDLQIESSGANFFTDAVARIVHTTSLEDTARVELSLQKEALLAQLTGTEPFMITYRSIVSGAPVYHSLKAVRSLTHDDHHIVIGISNVDTQVREAEGGRLSNELDFASLAQALSGDMESIYYVDLNSETYQEFSTGGPLGSLRLEMSGNDFFGECRRNIGEIVFADDRTKVAAALEKEHLLAALAVRSVYSMTYRLLINGKPTYCRLKAALAGKSSHHLIIGVSNIDSQFGESAEEPKPDNTISYASIVQALAMDYFSIFYVNTEDNSYVEYCVQDKYEGLDIGKSGKDFFEATRESIQRVIHADDEDMFLSYFTKENILTALERDKTFTLMYRLMLGKAPTYMHMKVTRMEDRSDKHIVVGISNVDEQIRRDQEHAQALRMANQDALTGVKSKYAYTTEERRINLEISNNAQAPFSVVVCDINDLKSVNDTHGHAAGDQYIKDACAIVCNVFKHSPVYRIGGDEFVAILRGKDFEARDDLMARLREISTAGYERGEVSLAGGIADWNAESDKAFISVFKRADAAMYADKRNYKSER